VRIDGRVLAYRRWGTRGTPVVLLGGFAEPSEVWRKVGPLVAHAGHRVYALDLPPFGYSQRIGPYDLAAWQTELEGFARKLGIARPVLVGHSLGAATVVGEALRDPSSLRGIVLLDGDALSGGGGPGWVVHLAVPPWYTALYRLLTGWDFLVRRILGSAYGPNGPPLTHAEVARWERPFQVAGTAQAFREMLPHGIPGWKPADLRAVHGVRALVVWGAHDTTDPVSAGREAARLLRAPFLLLPRSAHLSMLVSPQGVAAAIERIAG
jgi:pimeloyl-ACP methyl ester carboxylesterase